MLIQILSDLHFEADTELVPAVGDVIVAAGDLGTGKTALPQIDHWLASGAEVVQVLGGIPGRV